MDSYVDAFQKAGGRHVFHCCFSFIHCSRLFVARIRSLVMLAKGNRSRQVTKACKSYGGFYLGSIGGPAAILAQNNIKKVEVLEYAELGMEAVWKIEVLNCPVSLLSRCARRLSISRRSLWCVLSCPTVCRS